MKFEELNLDAELLRAVTELGFEEAMPVQEQVIPFVLNENNDLVALAQTGTGKTAAFGLPLLQLINKDRREVQALILSPTRELCIQISKDIKDYSIYKSDVHVVAVYGGEDIRRQLAELDRKPQIIVATPGRLIDLLRRGKINLNNVRHLVLDEADEMLNMGFKDEIETILDETPKERRTMLFSATMPAGIQRIARSYMKQSVEIAIGQKNAGSENVRHIYYMTHARYRYLALKRIVDLNPDIYGIVFCRTREETKTVAEKLMKDGYNADALHGDLSQAQRDTVMNRFRIGNLQLLVATDVAARGLDVSDLSHVINYNLPDDVEIYTHRSGRTGRAGKKGVSISIIHTREKHKIRSIEKNLKQKFEFNEIPSGEDICKRQLFAQINKMQHVEVNEVQINPFMEQVMNQLEYLSKEELLKRFVSLEFNRFLEYYKDAEDISVAEKESSGEERKRKRGGNRIRLKINVGRREGMNPARVLGVINQVTNDKSISIGDIDIAPNYTFFDVFEDQHEQITAAFEKQNEYVLLPVKGARAQSGRRAPVRKVQRKNDNDRRAEGRRGKNDARNAPRGDKPWRRKRR